MRALTGPHLLDVCEQAWSREPADRALIMATACLEMDATVIDSLSVGRRDSLLLEARQLTFGSHVECVSQCPACAAATELLFDLSQLTAETESTASPDPVSMSGFEISMRPPDTRDMRAASRAGSIEEALTILFTRCVSVRDGGHEIAPEAVPPDVVAWISEELEQRDTQADLRLAVVCPACGHQWTAAFDIVLFFWEEIQRAALKLLSEVQALAAAYGWSESEILAMSSWRRRAYLNVGAR